MKKILALALAFAGALSVSGCYTPQQQTGTLAGGAIGAGGGALIGSALTHGSPGGAIAGGLIGAGTGAMIGNAATAPPPGYGGPPPPGYGGPPPRQCAQWGYDYNGNRVCTAFY